MLRLLFIAALWLAAILDGVGPVWGQEGETPKEEAVYITRTGERYHREFCRYLEHSKIETSLKAALASGFTPCKVCRPALSKKVEQDAKPTLDGRCRAITKKGTRCKRSATSNGYCWQH